MQYNHANLSQWYWSRGLHDANIISAIKKESGYNPNDNYLALKIDCSGALFETTITEIRFYNFKIKTDNFDINSLNGGWWLSDQLSIKGNHYLIDLKFETSKCKTRRLELTFSRAEVIKE